MSESNFGESQAQFKAKDEKPTGNPLIHWLGAMVSVAVLAVMVYWGLQLVQRDPNEVPVIKAMEGPARVLPDDPGGTRTSYTGLAVNSVQSDGEAEEPSDRVVLAPSPRNLSPEDLAAGKLTGDDDADAESPVEEVIVNSVANALGDSRAADAQGDGSEPLVELEDRQEDGGPITLTVRDVPEGMRIDNSGSEARLVDENDGAGLETDAEAEDTAVDEPPNGSKYAVATSLIPQFRPNAVSLGWAAPAPPVNAPDPLTREVPDAPLGTRLIQLGAYDSRDTALKEWVRISTKHHDLLSGKNFLVQNVETGGREFYRLRAVGFADSTESKAMCSALIQRGAQCIPVVAR